MKNNIEIKKTSIEWLMNIQNHIEFSILDPDGWDRENYQYSFYEERISKEEFLDRLYKSTLDKCNGDLLTFLNQW